MGHTDRLAKLLGGFVKHFDLEEFRVPRFDPGVNHDELLPPVVCMQSVVYQVLSKARW